MTTKEAAAKLTSLLEYELRAEEALVESDEWDEERQAVLHETEETIEALRLGIEALEKEESDEIRPAWHPVSETPQMDGTYLVTMDGAICGEDKPIASMCGFENGKWDEEGYVLAWRVLPEQWTPELNHERTTKEETR